MLKRAVVEAVGKTEGLLVMWEAALLSLVGLTWVSVFSSEQGHSLSREEQCLLCDRECLQHQRMAGERDE